jgi:hypothetical protein
MARNGLGALLFSGMDHLAQPIFGFLQLPDGGVRWHGISALNLVEIARI